jgi:maleylpyruvate isomerase
MAGRSDLVTDPAIAAQLLETRRGQAFFSRKLAELRDADLGAPSLLDGWSRRHVIAHVGLNARALTRLVEWAATGVETPMYENPGQRAEEIDFGATLPAQALRNLSDHAAVHLTVEWRDLPAADWSNVVRTAQGRTVPVSETVWMRGREVWLHAIDLDAGARFDQLPAAFLDRLLVDVAGSWDRRRESEGLPTIVLDPVDRAAQVTSGAADGADLVVRGSTAALAQWATGRGVAAVTSASGGPVPAAPRWL